MSPAQIRDAFPDVGAQGGRRAVVVWSSIAAGVLVSEVAYHLFGFNSTGPAGQFADPDRLFVPLTAVLTIVSGVATLSSRFWPAAGLALMVTVFVFGSFAGILPVAGVAALAIVLFNCARRGRTLTVWASGIAIPVAYVFGGFNAANSITDLGNRALQGGGLPPMVLSFGLQLVGAAAPMALPWLTGLVLRMRENAVVSREMELRAEGARDSAIRLQENAEAVARLEHQKAQLAHDVHDVVGHSLTVILAQAESAAYLPGTVDPPLREVLDTIINSARSSLIDVRTVLTGTGTGTGAAANAGIETILAQIPASVGPVEEETIGEPRPLPPDIASAASRVLQEMITNVIRHGQPAGGIWVVRDWTAGLMIRVSNPASAAQGEPPAEGMGLVGMRRRVEAVGGHFEHRQINAHFVAEARLPLGPTIRTLGEAR